MNRPDFPTIYMQLAWLMSQRGTCARTNSAGEAMRCGSAVVSADFRQVLAVGYNGNAAGLPNACDTTEPGACGCIHAEENAVIACREARETPKVFFATHLPCVACSKRIIQLGGVVRVYYDKPYRITTGLDVLASVGISASRLAVAVSSPGHGDQAQDPASTDG